MDQTVNSKWSKLSVTNCYHEYKPSAGKWKVEVYKGNIIKIQKLKTFSFFKIIQPKIAENALSRLHALRDGSNCIQYEDKLLTLNNQKIVNYSNA